MKKLLLYLILVSSVSTLNAQKVAFAGVKHFSTSGDGVSILALDDLAVGEVFYFADNEYDNTINQFIDVVESVVEITVTTSIAKGNVIYFKEDLPSSSNTFTASVTSGSGNVTVAHVATSGAFSLADFGEIVYLYTDTDTDPTNGVTEIHAAFFPGSLVTSSSSGGPITPTINNPISDYPNAIVLHNFPIHDYSVAPYDDGVNRVEYNISAADRTNVNKVMLENPANYIYFGNNQDLATTFFSNFSLVTSNPIVTVTTDIAQQNEDSASNFNFTFALNEVAVNDVVINFTVNGVSLNGVANFGTDYTQTGASTMNTTSGTVTITSGTTSKTIVINPINDTTLEPDEIITLTIVTGTDYDFGSPSQASVTILNDDTITIVPDVAITGVRHYTSDENVDSAFSFVALKDIAAGSSYVFSSGSFTKSSLLFEDVSTFSSELKWIAPSGGILRGDVIVVKKNGPNSFEVTRNGSSTSTGVVSKLSPTKPFYISEYFGLFIAHTDVDDNPYNGIATIQSVIYTYDNLGNFGGNIPPSKDLSTLYIGSVLVDGFPNQSPSRLEYIPNLRPITDVDQANFENPSNWLYATPLQDLSPIPFHNIIISEGSSNPLVTVSSSVGTLVEGTATSAVFTFTLNTMAAVATTINFSVEGAATYTIDYTTSGATTFTGSQGSVTIPNGSLSAQVILTSIDDNVLEITENVLLTILSGVGYNGGSPSVASITITNDDTDSSEVGLAILGINHLAPTEMALVAMNSIAPNSTFYFLRGEFNTETLSFPNDVAIYKLVTPNSCLPKGTVLSLSGPSSGPLQVNCNGTFGSVCGSATILGSGVSFDFLDIGTKYYVYQDIDDDPSNGITQIHAVFHTGGVYPTIHTGGSLPPTDNPKLIYTNAIVVDNFPNSAPNRTEFNPLLRNIDITATALENSANWLHGEPNAPLSLIPFTLETFSNVFVDSNASVGGDGLSWATAFTTLQEAIKSCSNEIWVAAGTYYPSEDVFGNSSPSDARDKTFYLRNGVAFYGGFSGTETLLSERNGVINPTILSGDIGTTIDNSDNSYHVVVSVNDTSSTILDGFIIQDGNANGTGIVTIESSNLGKDNGGGLFNSNSSPTIQNCIFKENIAIGSGGGVCNKNASPTITNSIFVMNAAGSYGGGVSNSFSNAIFTNCVFTTNVSSNLGGALYNIVSPITLINCTFANNNAITDGGALYNVDSNPMLTNCIIFDNISNGNTTIGNAAVSIPVVNYSIIEGATVYPGTNNSNVAPQFTNLSNPAGIDDLFMTADDGLSIQSASATIDAGDPSITTPMKDITGLTRTNIFDIGAYEYDITLNQTGFDFLNTAILIFPNPTNRLINIKVKKGIFTQRIEIYDLTGRLVKAENINDNLEIIPIDSTQLAVATYTVKVITDKGVLTKKLVKI